MRLRLFPQDTRFYDLFTGSAENAVRGAELYLEMVKNFNDPKAAHKKIRECEHTGDEITHDTIRQLNTTFVTPIDREDIYGLATELDDVLDYIEAGADIYNLYRIEKPTQLAIDQAEILTRICRSVAALMTRLRHFRGLDELMIEIHSVENEGDQIYRRAIADLFNGDHKAIDVLKWKEIYDQIEAAVDVCEDVASRVEAIVLKHA